MTLYFEKDNLARPVFETSRKTENKYNIQIKIPDRIFPNDKKYFAIFTSFYDISIEFHKTRATLKLDNKKLVSYNYYLYGGGVLSERVATEALLSFLLYPIAYDDFDRRYLNTRTSKVGSIILPKNIRVEYGEFLKEFNKFLVIVCTRRARDLGDDYTRLESYFNSWSNYYKLVALPWFRDEILIT